jgi:hypothetical protein
MTNNEFETIKKARKILRKWSKNETIKSDNKMYHSYLVTIYDELDMFVYYVKQEKLVKG